MAFKRFRCHQIDQSEKQSDGANKKESHLESFFFVRGKWKIYAVTCVLVP